MKYWVTYPLASRAANPQLVSKEALTRFAQTAEAVGFDGIGFTDHPAPTRRWLQSGGHDALDPFAGADGQPKAVTARPRVDRWEQRPSPPAGGRSRGRLEPLAAPASLARTARTPARETAADLAVMLDDLWRRVDAAGRNGTQIDIAFTTTAGGYPSSESFNGDAHSEALEELASLGVTWTSLPIPGDSLANALESLERYGERVIAAHSER